MATGNAPRGEEAERRGRPANPDIQALRAGAVALVVLYHRDNNHITARFARTLTPFPLENLQRALE